MPTRRRQLPSQKRKNDTHASTSDPDAKLYRKAAGREARLSFMGHAVMENRNGLAVAGTVTQADGTAERRAVEALLKRKARRRGRRLTIEGMLARGEPFWVPAFEVACARNDIDHRLTKPKHP